MSDLDKEFEKLIEDIELPSDYSLHRETVSANNKKRNKERVGKLLQNPEFSKKIKERNSKHSKIRWDSLTDEKKEEQVKKAAAWHNSEIAEDVYAKISNSQKKNHWNKGKKTEEDHAKKISESLTGKKINRKKYYELHTPEGVFASRNEAAVHFKRKPDTITKWINTLKTDEFYWVKKENVDD